MSGLNINFDKTDAIWIGTSRGRLTRYMTHIKIRWHANTFIVLGITVSLDLDAVVNIYYEKNFTKVHKIIKDRKQEISHQEVEVLY